MIPVTLALTRVPILVYRALLIYIFMKVIAQLLALMAFTRIKY